MSLLRDPDVKKMAVLNQPPQDRSIVVGNTRLTGPTTSNATRRKMTPKRRKLMFRVMDEQVGALPLLHHFNDYHRCDEILTWLIRNKLTGKNFMAWVQEHFARNSLLEPARFILQKIDNEKEKRPILLGRDMV